MSTGSGWPALEKEAALGSWRWSMEPPGLPRSRPRQTWSSGASTETATDASWWWVCGEELPCGVGLFHFLLQFCVQSALVSERERPWQSHGVTEWSELREKGDRMQQKGAESERQLRNIMHNCSVNENLRRPLLPTKCKSSPYREPGNISQQHPLPVKSLSDLVLHSSRQVIESKSSSTKIIKSLAWTVPSIFVSQHPGTHSTGLELLMIHCSAPFRLPHPCSKALQTFVAPGACASLWICSCFSSAEFIMETLTDN